MDPINFMGFVNMFKRRKKVKREPADAPAGAFAHVWERKKQPSPGAQNYAFESLGLVQFTPSGPSVAVREPIVPLQRGPQPVVGQSVITNGVPTVSGQLYGQPLFDPNAGYVASPSPIINVPYQKTADPIGGQLL